MIDDFDPEGDRRDRIFLTVVFVLMFLLGLLQVWFFD